MKKLTAEEKRQEKFLREFEEMHMEILKTVPRWRRFFYPNEIIFTAFLIKLYQLEKKVNAKK